MSPQQSQAVITAYQDYSLELQEAIDVHIEELGKVISLDPESLLEGEKEIVYPACNAWHKLNQTRIQLRSDFGEKIYNLLMKDQFNQEGIPHKESD